MKAGEMAQELTALAALVKVLNSGPRTCIRQLTTNHL